MIYNCNFTVDQSNRELTRHGTTAFPIACYLDDLSQAHVCWHWHEEMEAGVVMEGEAILSIGAQTCTVSAGNGFLVNSGVLHSYQAKGDARCRLHVLVFHPRLVGGSMESVFYQKYVLPIAENRSMEGFFFHKDIPWQADAMAHILHAFQTCEQEPPYYELHVRNALSDFLALLLTHTSGVQAKANAKELRDTQRVKQMLSFIHQNYGKKLGTAAIAESASVSESECLRCFRSTIGTTPHPVPAGIPGGAGGTAFKGKQNPHWGYCIPMRISGYQLFYKNIPGIKGRYPHGFPRADTVLGFTAGPVLRPPL